MATFYLDPVNGLDSNNGSSWALARRSLTNAGWGGFPGLAADSVINVAKSPDPVSAGLVTVTNGSKQVEFVDAPVVTIFDKWGGPGTVPGGAITAIRNTYVGGSTGDFAFSGVAASGTRTLSLARPATTTTAYTVMGALTFAPITFDAADTHYVAVKIKGGRDYALKMALTMKSTAVTDPRLYNVSESTQADVDARRARASLVVHTTGIAASSQPVHVGGVLFSASETEYIGSSDTLFFPVPAGLTSLAGIGFLATGSSSSSTIEGVYLVKTLGARLPANAQPVNAKVQNRVQGLNVVVGTGQLLQQAESFNIFDTSTTTRAPAKFCANLTQNWGRATATASGLAALTTQISGGTYLAGGGGVGGATFIVRGGVNPTTNQQDGVTRISSMPPSDASVTASTSNFELFLRDANFSGFSTYNFAQGVRLQLNSTRANAKYTFQDVSGNTYGYYANSNDGSCPTNIVLNARNLGPNGANYVNMPAGCVGFTAAEVSPVVINEMSWSPVTAAATVSSVAAQFAGKISWSASATTSNTMAINVAAAPPTVTQFYIDPVNGVDTNNGLSWATARKTMTAAGWQSFPGLNGNSIINVKKSPDPVSASLLTFTNGSKNVTFSTNPVTGIFSSAGDRIAPTNPPRLYLASGQIALNGTAGSYTINVTAVQNSTAYTYVGAKEVTRSVANVTLAVTTGDFIAVRVRNRSNTATMQLGFNQATVTTPETAIGPVAGGNLFSATAEEKIGAVDTLFYRVPAGVNNLEVISFHTRDTATTSTFIIDSIGVVHNLDATLPNAEPIRPVQNGRIVNKGLNMVVGLTDPDYAKFQLSGFGTVTTNNGLQELFGGFTTFNWNYPSMTRVPGEVALTHHIDYNVFLSAGSAGGLSLTVRGGVEENEFDGVTRLSDTFPAIGSASPGSHNFELYLRNGNFSGFAVHNFAQGLRLKLNSTRENQNYTFDDMQGNNFGYYLYSDDGTCPSKVFLHYKNFGPNNALLKDATITACPGFSDARTKAATIPLTSSATMTINVGLRVPNFMVFRSSNTTSTPFRMVFPNPLTWKPVSVASTVGVSPIKRNRGMKFKAQASTYAVAGLDRNTPHTWAVVQPVTTQMKFGMLLRGDFNVTEQSTSAFGKLDFDKGFGWNTLMTSGTDFDLSMNVPFGMEGIHGTSATTVSFNRNRGYKWSVPMSVSIAEHTLARRPASYTVTMTPGVATKLMRATKNTFSSSTATSVVEAETVLRDAKPLVQATSSTSVGLLRQTTAGKFTIPTTATVNTELTRVRNVAMYVGATTAMSVKDIRSRDIEFSAGATSYSTTNLRRRFGVTYQAYAEINLFFDQNKLFRFLSKNNLEVGVKIGRQRGVGFASTGTTIATWKTGVHMVHTSGTITASTGADFALNRKRGLNFTIPVNSTVSGLTTKNGYANALISVVPDVVFSLNRGNIRGLSVSAQSENALSLRFNKGLDYSIDTMTSVDTELMSNTKFEQEDFGATTDTDFVFGIGRGMSTTLNIIPEVVTSMQRDIVIGFGVGVHSSINTNSQPNRLDSFYVEYEAPVTSSLKDGSVVLGQRKIFTSGVLHDARPTFDVVIMPAPTYTITLYEEELSYEY